MRERYVDAMNTNGPVEIRRCVFEISEQRDPVKCWSMIRRHGV